MTILEQFQQRPQTQELFLWAHLALLSFLPLALALTMAGLAVGDPLFPGWLEMPVLAVPIVVYGVWQQWHRPFYPFSLGLVYRSGSHLSVLQKQILGIVKRPTTGWIAVVVGVFLYVSFRQLYLSAPLAADIAPFPDRLRFLGIVWALVFFFLANVVAQLGMVALRVLVLPAKELNEEYDQEKIKEDFTVLGTPRGNVWQQATEPTPEPTPQNVEEEGSPDIPDLVFTTEPQREEGHSQEV